MAQTDEPLRRFNLPRVARNGVLAQRFPPEILQLILEHALVPPLSLTIRHAYYQQFRPLDISEGIDDGQGSCQAQLLRTCQELYELGLEVWRKKACFRLTVHCEGRHTSARTPHPFKSGKRDWLSTCYGGREGQLLLSRFQNVEMELIPDWSGTENDGFVITWTSSSVIADSLRFLNQHLQGKDLSVQFVRPELKADRVNVEELGMWMGLLELLRCKSLSVPQFEKYVRLNQYCVPLALVVSDEEVLDLDEKRNDFLGNYFDIMREINAPNDQYYNSTLVTKIKEKALQCNIKEYLYLRDLYADRLDQVSNQTHERPVDEDKRLMDIANWYGRPSRRKRPNRSSVISEPSTAHAESGSEQSSTPVAEESTAPEDVSPLPEI